MGLPLKVLNTLHIYTLLLNMGLSLQVVNTLHVHFVIDFHCQSFGKRLLWKDGLEAID